VFGGAGGFGGGGGFGSDFSGNGGFGGGAAFGGVGGFGANGGIFIGGSPFGGGGAGMGGAVFTMYGSTTILNSTLADNTAQGGFSGVLGSGGPSSKGPVETGSGLGGGLFNLDGSVSLTYTTIAENEVFGAFQEVAEGGAVYNLAFGNTQGGGAATATLSLVNSILGQDQGTDLVNDAENGKQTNTALVLGSTNLVQSSTQTGNGTTTIASGVITKTASPQFVPLANNGGNTLTLLPPTGSPERFAGNGNLPGLPLVDQRGLPRPAPGSGTNPDLGAVNHKDIAVTVGNLTTTFSDGGQALAVRATVTAFGQPAAAGQVQFSLPGLGPVTATIDSANPGVASATLQLPAGFAAGSYALTASYSGPFTGGTAPATASATLTVNPAPTSVTITEVKFSRSGLALVETVTASVTSLAGPVNGGTVTFTIAGQTVQAPVTGGMASAAVRVRELSAAGTHTVSAGFGGSNLQDSSTSQAVRLTLLEALFPGLTTMNAASMEALVLDLLFVQLALDGGGLTSIPVGPFSLPL
jgi:hypothetical protein